jgi:hypothetical protein
LDPRPLGYENNDERLSRLTQCPVTAPARQTGSARPSRAFYVSPVSPRPAASRAQIRAQNRFLTCGMPRPAPELSATGNKSSARVAFTVISGSVRELDAYNVGAVGELTEHLLDILRDSHDTICLRGNTQIISSGGVPIWSTGTRPCDCAATSDVLNVAFPSVSFVFGRRPRRPERGSVSHCRGRRGRARLRLSWFAGRCCDRERHRCRLRCPAAAADIVDFSHAQAGEDGAGPVD